ncbi:MAG TPA: SUMF1/EgtB/PvdO family nonheme iron enzyme, partial [Acetobacteraceae bacterium]|nr:SUMF1/EgtB/PvdO family nonheme iron enzyme [Acetobacteraceae bacterium]
RYVPGANWRHPDGPETTISARDHDPVVQIAWPDAVAFAAWSGKRLPSEAEWEYAARGGLDGATYCWGEQLTPDGRWMANIWQGDFPRANTALDGFAGRSPVCLFPANGYGVCDMAGNVWEWTATEYTSRHTERPSPCCHERSGEATTPRKLIKGGSYLCAPNYCLRYRPAARQPQSVDTASCHIGFRCVRDG